MKTNNRINAGRQLTPDDLTATFWNAVQDINNVDQHIIQEIRDLLAYRMEELQVIESPEIFAKSLAKFSLEVRRLAMEFQGYLSKKENPNCVSVGATTQCSAAVIGGNVGSESPTSDQLN